VRDCRVPTGPHPRFSQKNLSAENGQEGLEEYTQARVINVAL